MDVVKDVFLKTEMWKLSNLELRTLMETHNDVANEQLHFALKAESPLDIIISKNTSNYNIS